MLNVDEARVDQCLWDVFRGIEQLGEVSRHGHASMQRFRGTCLALDELHGYLSKIGAVIGKEQWFCLRNAVDHARDSPIAQQQSIQPDKLLPGGIGFSSRLTSSLSAMPAKRC